MASTKVLITGVTGFIGGSVLSTLLETQFASLKNIKLAGVVRGENNASVLKSKGIQPEIIQGIEDLGLLRKIAREYDVIINSAFAFQTEAAKALLRGLGDRSKQTGKQLHFIQETGTSNIADRPITGTYHEDRVFSDKDDIYSYLEERNAAEEYAQRTTNIVIPQLGLELGVKTYIIQSPTIYGIGTGFFRKTSIQIPVLTRAAIKAGQALLLGDGKAVWDYIHIADLSTMFEFLLAKILDGDRIPSGKEGMYFSETGRYAWRDLMQGIADAGKDLGVLKTNELKPITLEEGVQVGYGSSAPFVELAYASNSRSRAHKIRELGWKPQKTEEDFQKNFRDDFVAVLIQQ
ncbi:NAD dependent epimerase/dehydratase family protein [Mytilinidion resinicola]|uniref:NAD dependent epimerase/dehydratase family protein n=1 Tax=Mytilinidion resinicola TaxID=574789 RepID=A0A6A6YFW6_9PEZI|nr:NAD dependent epimerase/dehydratase family protein [Mytilinidion resinicola]KAF2806935.1 NAD dependent epimerase/dehydratase family protein [Mytilinidion resinicola]